MLHNVLTRIHIFLFMSVRNFDGNSKYINFGTTVTGKVKQLHVAAL
jgi:hypothetical protein